MSMKKMLWVIILLGAFLVGKIIAMAMSPKGQQLLSGEKRLSDFQSK